MTNRLSEPREDTITARWVAVCTGFTPGADYTPTPSDGDLASLADEVAQICKLFHVDPPPPAGLSVHLFWKSQGGDWVITRIQRFDGAPRIVLEYFSVIFSDREFAMIGRNPWRAIRANAHGIIKETYTRFSREPVLLPMETGEAGLTLSAPPQTALLPSAAYPERLPGFSFESGGETEWNPGLAAKLEAYCDDWSAQTKGSSAPPTFATWWPHSAVPPRDMFAIVFKNPAPKHVTTLETAEALARELSAAVQRYRGGASRGLLAEAVAAADAAYTEFRAAQQEVRPDESGNRESWGARRSEAAKQAATAMTKIKAARMALSSRPDAELADLDDLATRFDRLALRLSQERYPAPFGRAEPPRGDLARGEKARGDLVPTRPKNWLAGGGKLGLATPAPVSEGTASSKLRPGKNAIFALCGALAVAVALLAPVWPVQNQNAPTPARHSSSPGAKTHNNAPGSSQSNPSKKESRQSLFDVLLSGAAGLFSHNNDAPAAPPENAKGIKTQKKTKDPTVASNPNPGLMGDLNGANGEETRKKALLGAQVEIATDERDQIDGQIRDTNDRIALLKDKLQGGGHQIPLLKAQERRLTKELSTAEARLQADKAKALMTKSPNSAQLAAQDRQIAQQQIIVNKLQSQFSTPAAVPASGESGLVQTAGSEVASAQEQRDQYQKNVDDDNASIKKYAVNNSKDDVVQRQHLNSARQDLLVDTSNLTAAQTALDKANAVLEHDRRASASPSADKALITARARLKKLQYQRDTMAKSAKAASSVSDVAIAKRRGDEAEIQRLQAHLREVQRQIAQGNNATVDTATTQRELAAANKKLADLKRQREQAQQKMDALRS